MSKYTGDDLWPNLHEIYLIFIPNKREFYELQVLQIVDENVNCVQSYGRLSTKV